MIKIALEAFPIVTLLRVVILQQQFWWVCRGFCSPNDTGAKFYPLQSRLSCEVALIAAKS
jgi:hypothetical protein